MRFMKQEREFVVRLEEGEEIVGALNAFCAAHGITGGSVQGIGAVRDATIGCYSLEKKDYVRRELRGEIEIVSLMGNVTMFEGKPFVHVHAALAGRIEGVKEEFAAVGGHLFRGIVSPMAEVTIGVMEAAIHRVKAAGTAPAMMDLDGAFGPGT